MVINQGDIFWITLPAPRGSEPGYRHPHVVIQNNATNRTGIRTVIMCALTSNLRRAAAPGNLMLVPAEANLPRQSAVNVSQLYTIDKSQLTELIGTLSPQRVRQILDGLRLLTEPREA